MSDLKIYPDGTPFIGTIGRTTEESSPAWPEPARALFNLTSNIPVPEGEVTLRYEFEPTGKANFAVGKGVPVLGPIYINNTLVGALQMPYSVPSMFDTEGLTCGYDGGDRVAPKEYADAFPFTGTLKRVTLDLSGELIPDSEHDMKVAMVRQ